MHRRPLLALLERYTPAYPTERESYDRIVSFVTAEPRCFDRRLPAGHITGSAWVLSPDGRRALLSHHRKLGKWLQLGGHADGHPDILNVALREAREESGIQAIEPASPEIFDVDVHPIPARNGEPPHLHYDIRFRLYVTGDIDYRVSEESLDLAWVTPEEVSGLDVDESVLRLQRKWIALSEAGRR
ncbi:MAG: NUDIX hydrolase [Planctomycetes bacterium]|nr:NUDIX hydrolase [Planctomycetota bacterium]